MLKKENRKPSSKAQSTEVKELQTLTIAELNVISGAGMPLFANPFA